MSERILRVLMQLFAILAKDDELEDELGDSETKNTPGRLLVEDYLRSELSTSLIDFYLNIFDKDLQTLHQSALKKDGKRKRTSVNSVKVLRICAQINKELTQKQKILVLIRVIEYILLNQNNSKQDFDFVETIAESFNVKFQLYERIRAFIQNDISVCVDDNQTLYISSKPMSFEFAKSIVLDNLDSEIRILRLDSSKNLYFRYLGNKQLFLNGQVVSNKRVQILSTGSSLKTDKSNQLYYSDVIAKFLSDDVEQKLEFSVKQLSYRFSNDKIGLHEISFNTESGKLIGIMGGSGSGKSTLINLLNGNIKPATGSIEINGINLIDEPDRLEGIIGYVSQDDVFFEELTVYQNLYFNAELCFKNLSSRSLHKKVLNILYDVGLYNEKSLKVGSLGEKIISGGQRKRLNIALELIRQPTVLFLDEPTSGLSSKDSENIMDLMKELTSQGKLIFVIIHQPSSEVFKMFDRLFLMDLGGYLVYDGNPIDSLVYFKMHVNHANANQRDCAECGNVNPEQIFNILESKVVDENGSLTKIRKTEAKEWYEKYRKERVAEPINKKIQSLNSESKIPNKFHQFKIFIERDVLSKIENKQYLLVNFLEAPLLALLVAFVLRYSGNNSGEHQEIVYTLYYNENITQYILISTVVAIFMGLIASAEEIFRDKQILKRESFLNLSRSSYIFSKLAILFSISAIQTLTYVLIGNSILEIKGLWLEYWFVLFTVSCSANIIGLIISSSFNSVKVIYIVIPLLIIPQILFSGVLVRFDKFNPAISSQKEVPFIGNIAITRWAFEALAVEQQLNNPIYKKLINLKIKKSESAWKRDYWIPTMQEQLAIIQNKESESDQVIRAKIILQNEIKKEELVWSNFKCDNCIEPSTGAINTSSVNYFLSKLRLQYINQFKISADSIDRYVEEIGLEKYSELEREYINESLTDLVTNRNEFDKIIKYNGALIQKADEIYLYNPSDGFFSHQFFSPYKYIFGNKIPTASANMLFIWFCAFPGIILLYYDVLKLVLQRFSLKRN